MNKFKITKREAKENYYILSIGYCKLQNALSFHEPIAYSAGKDGWSCDYYDINGVLISTGYSRLSSKRCNASNDEIKALDKAAWTIKGDHTLSYKEQKEKVNNLLYQFIEKSKDAS